MCPSSPCNAYQNYDFPRPISPLEIFENPTGNLLALNDEEVKLSQSSHDLDIVEASPINFMAGVGRCSSESSGSSDSGSESSSESLGELYNKSSDQSPATTRAKNHRGADDEGSKDELDCSEFDGPQRPNRSSMCKATAIRANEVVSKRDPTRGSCRSSRKSRSVGVRRRGQGTIIDEREVRQQCGRPRKQYLVRWQSSWEDKGPLVTPAILRQWEETKKLNLR